jgi:Glycosyl transferase family 2
MRLVETLVVRDEADIVDAQLAYHLNAGVDFVIATDHESGDGTTEILEAYARDGYLRRIPEQGWNREDEWRTSMARLAAREHGADWVINTDADEFWMPRGGVLKDVFDLVPASVGIVWALSRHFVPPLAEVGSFAERMTVRLSATAPINDPTSPYRPHGKVAHRADPDIVVRHGAHGAWSRRLVPLPDWHPFDVLHFPFRSMEQYERKCVRRARGDKPLGQYVAALHASEAGRIDEQYRSLVVDDETLERGCAAGSLVVDTRLRDALRDLQTEDGFHRPGREAGPGDGWGGLISEPDHDAILEAAALREAEVVRLARSVDVLRARLGGIEARTWARARRRRGSAESDARRTVAA